MDGEMYSVIPKAIRLMRFAAIANNARGTAVTKPEKLSRKIWCGSAVAGDAASRTLDIDDYRDHDR